MTYTFSFDPKRKLIRVVQDQPENVHSALEVMREVRMHPEFHAEYGILCDFRKGDFPKWIFGLAQMSEVIKVFFPGQRIALVYSDPERAKSGRYVAVAAATAVSVQIFDTLDSAESWLGSATATLDNTESA